MSRKMAMVLRSYFRPGSLNSVKGLILAACCVLMIEIMIKKFVLLVISMEKKDPMIQDASSNGQLPAAMPTFFPSPKHFYKTGHYIPGEDGTYAQNYQDVWFESLAYHNGWLPKGKGFYIDLGAFLPLVCSNSAKLELQYSWDGICVEPRVNMGFQEQRPRTVEVNRAMTGTSGKRVSMGGPGGQLFHVQDSHRSGQQLVTTMNARDLISCVNSTATPETDCSGVHATTVVPNFIHLVTMDVEGNEADLLRTWPWELVEVAVFIIETGGVHHFMPRR